MLPMPDTQTTEDRATQLLYSIQFKLSHAMYLLNICRGRGGRVDTNGRILANEALF